MEGTFLSLVTVENSSSTAWTYLIHPTALFQSSTCSRKMTGRISQIRFFQGLLLQLELISTQSNMSSRHLEMNLAPPPPPLLPVPRCGNLQEKLECTTTDELTTAALVMDMACRMENPAQQLVLKRIKSTGNSSSSVTGISWVTFEQIVKQVRKT